MTSAEHKVAAGERAVPTAVITCSDSRTEATDVSGGRIKALLAERGHPVVFYAISPDEPGKIRALLTELVGRGDVRAIILNGGTGVSPRDNTFDAVAGMMSKTLPGFGELFRMLSYQAVGSAAMLSRAVAGIIVPERSSNMPSGAPAPLGMPPGPKIVFSIPGSPNAVEVAMGQLILPELSHLAWETTR